MQHLIDFIRLFIDNIFLRAFYIFGTIAFVKYLLGGK
jgi:hypothetical protein